MVTTTKKSQVFCLALALLFCNVATFGSDAIIKERTYVRAFDDVWQACVQTGSEQNKIHQSDKASGFLSLQKASLGAGPGRIDIIVVPVAKDQTSVTLKFANKLGMRKAAQHAADLFFSSLAAKLQK